MHARLATFPTTLEQSALTRWLLPDRLGCGALLHLILVVSVCGCASVRVVELEHLHNQQLTEHASPVAHIQGSNWGWYLFKFIPLITGNLDNPKYPQWPNFFRDNVTPDHVVDLVTKKSEELGGTLITDLRSTDKSGWVPVTLILWLNEVEVSANASVQPGIKRDR